MHNYTLLIKSKIFYWVDEFVLEDPAVRYIPSPAVFSFSLATLTLNAASWPALLTFRRGITLHKAYVSCKILLLKLVSCTSDIEHRHSVNIGHLFDSETLSALLCVRFATRFPVWNYNIKAARSRPREELPTLFNESVQLIQLTNKSRFARALCQNWSLSVCSLNCSTQAYSTHRLTCFAFWLLNNSKQNSILRLFRRASRLLMFI